MRTELHLYDLAVLGNGSCLTLEGLIQHDNLRDTQAETGLYVRVPFGSHPGRRLGRMRRHMVDRIVRDVDVVANNQTIDDPANFASTGVAIDSVRVVDANDDLSTEVAAAGEGSVVVVDSSAGIISKGDTTVLSSGQVVMGGGGSTLNVVGRNTGAQAQFSTPGTRPLVNGTNAGNDVFRIANDANDSTLTGLDITGGACATDAVAEEGLELPIVFNGKTYIFANTEDAGEIISSKRVLSNRLNRGED